MSGCHNKFKFDSVFELHYLCNVMPVNFLKKIVLQKERNREGNRFLVKESLCRTCVPCIEGFYIFCDVDYMKEHWIFNDGYPSVVLFPCKDDKVNITIDGKAYIYESGWIDSGIIRKAYVSFPAPLDYIIVIRFMPGYFLKLFNLPASFFRDRNITPLSNVNTISGLSDKIFATRTVPEKIDLIESFIACPPHRIIRLGLIDTAIRLVNDNKGQISVANIAHELKVNYKWLERNFISYLGITPKEYIQLQRFIYTYINLSGKPCNLHDTAIAGGYYDYNHFIKEFKSFTGKTPAEYLSTDNSVL